MANQLVFTWNGPKQDNGDIYVKLNGTENLLRLTQNSAPDYAPAWSPDGRNIAFLRDLPGGHVEIMMIPSFGGPPWAIGWMLHGRRLGGSGRYSAARVSLSPYCA